MNRYRAQVSGSLARALGIGRSGIYAFVGAGGKTSAIRRLLAERPQALATTTTQLSRSGFGHGLLVVAPDSRTLLELQADLPRARPLTLALSGAGLRLQSPSLSWHLQLYQKHRGDLVFVEADGAARRWLKRPAPHEPAWPPTTSATAIIVVGLAALGEPIREALHRPASFERAHLGARTVGLEHVALMLRDYVLAAPPRSPLTLLLTGVRSQHEAVLTELTRHFASLVHARDPSTHEPNVKLRVVACEDVQSGSCRFWQLPPGRQVRVPGLPGVCGVLLAAGSGERFRSRGAPASKLLARWRRRPLIEHTVATWSQAGFAELLVVLGHAAEELRPHVLEVAAQAQMPVRTVVNRHHARGLATSVRTAVRQASPGFGMLFGLADMPALRVATLRHLATLGSNLRRWIIVPTVAGNRRNPVFFPSDLRGELLRLAGASGGRSVIQAHPSRVLEVELGTKEEYVDVDRPRDLAKLSTSRQR